MSSSQVFPLQSLPISTASIDYSDSVVTGNNVIYQKFNNSTKQVETVKSSDESSRNLIESEYLYRQQQFSSNNGVRFTPDLYKKCEGDKEKILDLLNNKIKHSVPGLGDLYLGFYDKYAPDLMQAPISDIHAHYASIVFKDGAYQIDNKNLNINTIDNLFDVSYEGRFAYANAIKWPVLEINPGNIGYDTGDLDPDLIGKNPAQVNYSTTFDGVGTMFMQQDFGISNWIRQKRQESGGFGLPFDELTMKRNITNIAYNIRKNLTTKVWDSSDLNGVSRKSLLGLADKSSIGSLYTLLGKQIKNFISTDGNLVVTMANFLFDYVNYGTMVKRYLIVLPDDAYNKLLQVNVQTSASSATVETITYNGIAYLKHKGFEVVPEPLFKRANSYNTGNPLFAGDSYDRMILMVDPKTVNAPYKIKQFDILEQEVMINGGNIMSDYSLQNISVLRQWSAPFFTHSGLAIAFQC